MEVGLFGEARRVSEDFELWLRLAVRWKVGFIDAPLVQYRRRRGSLSEDKLATGQSALEVIDAFWREHSEYRKSHPEIYRKSLAHHLAIAGSAALDQGKQRTAFAYLLRSLVQVPWEPRSWKGLAKAIVRPVLRRADWTTRNRGGKATCAKR